MILELEKWKVTEIHFMRLDSGTINTKNSLVYVLFAVVEIESLCLRRVSKTKQP